MLWYFGLLVVLAVLYWLLRRMAARRAAEAEQTAEGEQWSVLGQRNIGRLEFLEWLKSEDDELRAKGSLAAMTTKLKLDDLSRVYQAIREAYTSDELTEQAAEAHASLIRALWQTHDASTVGFIREIFPTLPRDSRILRDALRVLGEINTRSSLEALLDLLEEHDPDLGRDGYSIFAMQHTMPLHANQAGVLFPRLFALLDNGSLKVGIYELAAAAREQGVLSAEALAGLRDRLVEDCRSAIHQRATAELHSWEHDGAADLIGATLSLFSSLKPDQEIVRVLKGILEMPGRVARLEGVTSDLRLKATLTLLRMAAKVPTKLVERFAADPRTRVELFDELEAMGKGGVFPQTYRSQESLAEAEMVHWLCSPSEMLGPPQQIELMDTRVATVDGERGRYYVYKFYYDHNPKLPHMPSGWLVGVSGPWPTDTSDLDRSSGRSTFSTFPAVDDADVDGHFAAYLEYMGSSVVPVKRRRNPYRHDV